MSLASRLSKAKVGVDKAILSKSDFNNLTTTDFDVPALNIAFSGSCFDGFKSGLTIFAAPSKHFKTLFSLMMVSAYLNEHKDSACVFFDSEGGASMEYFAAHGIDPDRVIHVPVANIEELKSSMTQFLNNEISKEDKVIFFVDSIGNLASIKEIEDALDSKTVADMTRAKALKSFGRIITPYLNNKDVPCIAINHTYDEIGMFPKTIMGGGTGMMYSANNVFFIGKRQVKDGKDLLGYEFVLITEKSRNLREKAQIPITVTYDGGIDKWSGLFEIALRTGHIVSPKQGWYTRPSIKDDKNWRRKSMGCEEFWYPILEDDSFDKAVGKMYKLSEGGAFRQLIDEDGNVVDPDTGEILNKDE